MVCYVVRYYVIINLGYRRTHKHEMKRFIKYLKLYKDNGITFGKLLALEGTEEINKKEKNS